MTASRFTKRFSTVLLVVAFVVLFAVYLSSADQGRDDVPSPPTVTVQTPAR
ncbi:MAG: hypothetical protein QM728_10670 [Gordonia sp. (in: high G+C Gram-positive bacteria)]|uniref:hypothetical protein n=1 Tax=Gordonia sp. (in: high G+C Gram-positive bacteria) TaxID=84139 RepID=UPI0039E2FF55